MSKRVGPQGDIVYKWHWDDLRFPSTADKLTVSAGRLDYDFFNGGIKFETGATYPSDPVSMLAQIPHKVHEGSTLRPHIHWLQTQANEPNWLLAYKIINNGKAHTIESDYTNFNLSKKLENVYTYTSDNLVQITKFDPIDTSLLGLSGMIYFVLFRDTTHVSSLFTVNDPCTDDSLVFEFDLHYRIDKPGSRQEYSK